MKSLDPNWHVESVESAIWSKNQKRIEEALGGKNSNDFDIHNRSALEIATATCD